MLHTPKLSVAYQYYKYSEELNKHLKEKHPYCARCQEFFTDATIQDHKRNSGRHNICVVCHEDFEDIDDLHDHIDQEHFECNLCDKVCPLVHVLLGGSYKYVGASP